jgi:hypothetical protein
MPTPVPAWGRDLVLAPALLVLPALVLRRLALARAEDRLWLLTLAAGAAAFPLARLGAIVSDLSGWGVLHWATAALVLAGPATLLVGLVLAVRQRMSGVRVNVVSGRSQRRQHQDSRVEGFLPARPVTVRLENVEGPGTVEIVQQPEQANGFTARVRITNSEPSRAEFRFTLRW